MKKFLLISVFLGSMIFVGCSQQKWLSQDKLFEKKQECAKYKNEMQKQLSDFSLNGIENVLEVKEIFYSPIKNSCLFTVNIKQESLDTNESQENQENIKNISKTIIDYFGNNIEFSISKDFFNVDKNGFNKQKSDCSKQFLSGINEIISAESKQKTEEYINCMNQEYEKRLQKLKWE